MSTTIMVHIGASSRDRQTFDVRTYGKTERTFNPVHVSIVNAKGAEEVDLVFYEESVAREFIRQLEGFLSGKPTVADLEREKLIEDAQDVEIEYAEAD